MSKAKNQMMFSRLTLLVLVASFLFGLGACGKKQNDEQPADVVEKPPAITIDLAAITAEIPATDELGSFQSDVSGIAFWQHPTKPYESGIFAANGAAGLFLLNFEGQQLGHIKGNFNRGVALTYLQGAGELITLLLAWDSTLEGYQLFKWDHVKMSAARLTSPGFSHESPRALCMGRTQKPGTISVVLQPASMTKRVLHYTIQEAPETATFVINKVDQVEIVSSPMISCTSDEMTGDIYVLLDNNEILKNFAPFAKVDTGNGLSIDVFSASNPKHTKIIVATSGVKDDQAALFHLYDPMGKARGRLTIQNFDTIDRVKSVSAFAVGFSNFGGLYRDGVIGVVEGTQTRNLKLAPWSAAANSLGFEISSALSERTLLTAEQADEATAETINLPEFTDD